MIDYHDLAWFKSSYSKGDTNCVETAWRKSSYSQGQNNCVESATGAGTVYLRDSKLGDASPILSVNTTEWRMLLTAIRSTEPSA